MYALADYIGGARVNQALRKFRDARAFKGAPYPNTTELVAPLREVTPPELQYVVDDMFERIVVYDNRATEARARALPGGSYEVTVRVAAKKRVADELGKETDVALADFIDIGVLDAADEPILIERRRIDAEAGSFTLSVDRKPARAGIDPLNKLIDRRPNDNTLAVTIDGD